MKKLFILFFFIPCFVSAQHWSKVYSYNEYLGLQADSVLIPPGDTLSSAPIKSLAIKNNHVYQKLASGIWSQVDGGGNAVQSLTGSQSIQYGPFLSMPGPGTPGSYYAATDSARWYIDNGVVWINLSGTGGAGGGVTTASGDANGTAVGTNLPLTVTAIQGKGITLSTGNLRYNGSAWVFDNTTYLPVAASPGQVVVANGSGVLTPFTVTGDLAFTSSGVGTVNVNAITNAKLAQMPANTVKGNNTGSPANAADLTVAQMTSLLSIMTNFSGAPGQVEGTYAGIPAATGYATGTTYIAQDSGFLYVDTGSGGARGWKKMIGGAGGSSGNFVTNFLASQQLGYGLYANKPTTGTGFYYASDSSSWYYINASTVINLTNFNLWLKQGLKPYHGSTDTAAWGGTLLEPDTVNMNFFHLLFTNMLNEATIGANDSLVVKTANGELLGTTPLAVSANLAKGSRIMSDPVTGMLATQAEIIHTPAKWGTAAALPTNTYSNGTAGVGATLTATANGALSVDGNAVATNDRVLVKNEAATANNGLYTVTQTGSGGTPYILTRGGYSSIAANMTAGSGVFVQSGTANANTLWFQQTLGTITFGTTSLVYATSIDPAVATKVTNYNNILFIGSGTFASKPAASGGSGMWYATDQKDLWYSNGTTWVQITDPQGGDVVNGGASNQITTGVYSARPSASGTHNYYFATDSLKIYYDNGSWLTFGGSGGSGTTLTQGWGTQILTDGGNTYVHATTLLPSRDTIYIGMTGQSQFGFAASLTSQSDITVNPNVLIFNRATNTLVVADPHNPPFPGVVGSTIGCNIGWYLGKYVQQATGKIVVIVDYYHTSTPIANWYIPGSGPQADMDSFLVYTAAAGIAQYDLLFWGQGEQNTGTGWSISGLQGGYMQSFDSLVAFWRREYFCTSITPILVLGMPKVAQGSTTDYKGIDSVLQSIGSGRDFEIAYVPTDSAQVISGDIHYSNVGKKTVAFYAFQQWRSLPWRVPNTFVKSNWELLQSNDSSGSAQSQSEQLQILNTHPNGIEGIRLQTPTSTSLTRLARGNPSAVLSPFQGSAYVPTTGVSLNTLGHTYLSSEVNVPIDIWVNYNMQMEILNGETDYYNMVFKLINGNSNAFNYQYFLGDATNSKWIMGVNNSGYTSAGALANHWELYNFTNGYQFAVSPTGQTTIGTSTSATGSTHDLAQLQINPAAPVNNNGRGGVVEALTYQKLQDISSAASSTTTDFAVSGEQGDTLTASQTGVIYTNAYTRLFGAPASGNHVTITNPFAIGVLGYAYDSLGLFVGTKTIDPAAIAKFVSTTKAVIPPVMTTAQFTAIGSLDNGGIAALSDSLYRLGMYNGTKYVTYATTDMLGSPASITPTNATDANYTVLSTDVYIILPTITANRTLTLPTATGSGRTLWLKNANTAGLFWNFSGTVKDPEGITVGGIKGMTTMELIDDASGQWSIKTTFSNFFPNSLRKEAHTSAQSTSLSPLLSYTDDGKAANQGGGVYRIGVGLNIVSITTDIIELQVSYTDENNVSQTINLIPMGVTSPIISITGPVLYPSVDIFIRPGTTININSILTVSSGSINYDATANIMQIQSTQ